jgi:hypothetical protein
MENAVLSLLLLSSSLSPPPPPSPLSSSSSKACYMCTVPCSVNTTLLIVLIAAHYIESYAINLSSVVTSAVFYLT